MIKKKIAILFLLVFSLGFTAQYSTTKGKNVKMSQQEMDKNAAEIVELLKFLDMDEVKQSTIREVKEDMKRKIGEGENYLQSRVLEMIRDIMGIIIENRETTVTKVTFLSNKEADVEIEIKTAEVLDEEGGLFEKNIEKIVGEEYIKKYGEMPEISKVKNSSKAEQKKVMDRLDSVAKEVIKNNIRNKKVNYNFLNGKLKVVKTSDGWKVKG